MKYRLADGVKIAPDGTGGVLMRQYPLRTIRCNTLLYQLLSKIRCQGSVESSSPVMETLATAGFVERVWEKTAWEKCPSVSVIIPVKDRAEELRRCLDSLKKLDYPTENLEIIVVDDGSIDSSQEIAKQAGSVCISSGGEGKGPAAARNKGALRAKGELLAFLDSDCTASSDWLRILVAPFIHDTVAAVGGKVRGFFKKSWLDRYEDTMSSLTLGAHETWAGKGDDSFYLPSCNLVVRKEHFLCVGGFDEGMQVGEDVDLCYRLRDKGYVIGHLPLGEIFHAHRNKLLSFMARRLAYGTSEALLQQKHRKRHKKMQMPFLALIALAILSGILVYPLFAVIGVFCVLAFDIGLQYFRAPAVTRSFSFFIIAAARLRTMFSLGYYISYHLTRYYLPLLLPLACMDFRITIFVVCLFFWSAGVDYLVKKADLNFLSFSFIYFSEQFAYSCGVFWGCLKNVSFQTYRVIVHFEQLKG